MKKNPPSSPCEHAPETLSTESSLSSSASSSASREGPEGPLVLFPHQEEGVSWMVEREKCHKCPGGLLLDDCGVGKTAQVIATLVKHPQPMTLIVGPVNILKQWEAQLHRWAPHFCVLLYHQGRAVKSVERLARRPSTSAAEIKARLVQWSRPADVDAVQTAPQVTAAPTPQAPQVVVVLTSYGKLTHREFERRRKRQQENGTWDKRNRYKTGKTALHHLTWDRVVLDECHLIRNHGTTRTRYVLALRSRIRWGLTATPIHNGIKDYQTLLRFLGLKEWQIAHVLGTHPALEKYLTRQGREMVQGRVLDLDLETGVFHSLSTGQALRMLVRHDEITLRRTKKQVFQDVTSVKDDIDVQNAVSPVEKDGSPHEMRRGRKRSRAPDQESEEIIHGQSETSQKKAKVGVEVAASDMPGLKAPELPPLKVDIVPVDFCTTAEAHFYRRLESAARMVLQPNPPADADHDPNLDAGAAPPPDDVTDQMLFELILRLRQASVNPNLVISGFRKKFRGRFPVNLLPSWDEIGTYDVGEMASAVEVNRGNVGVMTRAQRRRRDLERREHCMVAAIGVPSKTRALCDMVRRHRLKERAIVFCEFREEMPLLQRDLAAVGVSSVCYDGSISMNQRDDIVRRMSWTTSEVHTLLNDTPFMTASGCGRSGGRSRLRHWARIPLDVADMIARMISWDCILVQINSGNAGLNLQMCSRVYYTNPTWNPCTEIQAYGRAHRMGQTEPVHVVKLVLSGQCQHCHNDTVVATDEEEDESTESRTVDHRVLEVQQRKRGIMADILGDEDILFNGTIRTTQVPDDVIGVAKNDMNTLTRNDLMQILGANG